MLQTVAGLLVPALAVFVLLYGLIKKVDVYDAFVQGAADGLPVLYRLLPYLAAMLIAVQTLRDGGLFTLLTDALRPLLAKAGVEAELLPLILIRPFSGSAAMALVAELYETHGVDSDIGYTASVLMGSSETIFYELALYFGAVGVKKTRFTVPVALAAGAVGVAVSLML